MEGSEGTGDTGTHEAEGEGGRRRRRKVGSEKTSVKITDRQPAARPTLAQFTLFWPIMFYRTIADGTVVTCDLISQPISFSNVNTKGEAEAISGVHRSSTATRT